MAIIEKIHAVSDARSAAHLLHQLLADGVEFGFHALLSVSCLPRVVGFTVTGGVVVGAGVRDDGSVVHLWFWLSLIWWRWGRGGGWVGQWVTVKQNRLNGCWMRRWVNVEVTGLHTLNLGFGGRLRLRALRAHGLSTGEGVQRPQFAGSWGALQSGAAGRRVDPAEIPGFQRADEAASTAGLPQQLGTSGRHSRTLAHPLRSARRTSDRLRMP